MSASRRPELVGGQALVVSQFREGLLVHAEKHRPARELLAVEPAGRCRARPGVAPSSTALTACFNLVCASEIAG